MKFCHLLFMVFFAIGARGQVAVPIQPGTPVVVAPPVVAPPVIVNPVPIDPNISVRPAGDPIEGVTDLVLNQQSNRDSRVTVPAGELLRVTAPDAGPGGRYQWRKNGLAMPLGNERVLTLQVKPADAAVYHCELTTGANVGVRTNFLTLGVARAARLLNVSVRGMVPGNGGPGFILGFVIGSSTASARPVLLRVIGPSLTQFGVTQPLPRPVVRLFGPGFNYTPIGPVPTADELASVGASPTSAGSADISMVTWLGPGVYTAHVTSSDAHAGEVVLEIFELP
jgi:hypothetical protein